MVELFDSFLQFDLSVFQWIQSIHNEFLNALMGFSRIYVEVHYCTDVMFGILTGTICAFIAVLIVKFLFPVVDKGINKLTEKVKKKN